MVPVLVGVHTRVSALEGRVPHVAPSGVEHVRWLALTCDPG